MKPVIFIGNTAVDVQDNISVVLRNPLFNENGIPGSYVFNFSLPLSDQIKKEINFSHVAGITRKVYRKEVSILAGSLNLRGIGNITAISERKIEVSLLVFTASLVNELKDLNLRDIDLGEIPGFIDFKVVRGLVTIASQGHWASPYDRINLPLRFGQPVDDPDNTFPGLGFDFVAPQSKKYNFSFRVRFIVEAGTNLRFSARKNDSSTVYLKTYPEPPNEQMMHDFLSFSVYLNQGDTIRLHVRLDAIWLPSGMDPDGKPYFAHLVVYNNSRLFVYSDLNIDNVIDRGYPYHNYTFFPIHNNNFYANASSSVYKLDDASLDVVNKKYPFVNFYDDGFPLMLSYSEENESLYKFNTISPLIYLAHIVKSIFDHLGISITNNVFVGDGNITQLCVYANAAVNNLASSSLNDIPSSFNLNQALPDMKAADFLLEITKTLGIAFSYDHKNKNIRFYPFEEIMDDQSAVEFSDNIIDAPEIALNPFSAYVLKYKDMGDPYVDEYYKDTANVNFRGQVNSINDLGWQYNDNEINDCYYVIDIAAYLYWTIPEALSFPLWRFYAYRFKDEHKTPAMHQKSNEVLEYELPATPIPMLGYPFTDPSHGYGREFITPASFRPGIIKGAENDDPSYHLVFYRGMQKDSDGNDYPLGSNSYKSYHGDIDFSQSLEQPLDLALDNGENSIYTKRFKKYLDWRVNTHGEYKFYKMMTSGDLMKLDFFRWHRILTMDFLLKEVKFEITARGISPVEIIALPRDAAVFLHSPSGE